MKPITDPKRVQRATNCDGPNEWFTDQEFEVEASDVGHKKPNYLGYQHATFRLSHSDVGRHILVTRQPFYECWSFTLTLGASK